jgi:chromosome segregation ATPase
MIANDYQLESAKAELAKLQGSLTDLEAILATLPQSIAAQVKAYRPSTIRQRIRELEAQIQQYARTQRDVVVTVSHSEAVVKE